MPTKLQEASHARYLLARHVSDLDLHAGRTSRGVGPRSGRNAGSGLPSDPRAEGTQEGEFQGYAPTGIRVNWTGMNVFRFECGLIAEEWSEVDGLGRLRQLGVLGTPTP